MMQVSGWRLKAVLINAALSMVATVLMPRLATGQGTNPAPDFPRRDASTLPITQKIHLGGDPDWMGIGFGSVWVSVAKNNEVVRIDPVRNVVQARVPVDKEPCYGIGIGVDRVWVLNCQSKTLTRINPQTNTVDLG